MSSYTRTSTYVRVYIQACIRICMTTCVSLIMCVRAQDCSFAKILNLVDIIKFDLKN